MKLGLCISFMLFSVFFLLLTASSLVNCQESVTATPVEPFGFRAGRTKAELISLLGKRAVDKDNGDIVLFRTAPKPHPDFKFYAAFFSPTVSLAKVTAGTEIMKVNSFGNELQSKFAEIRSALAMKYGSPEDFDMLKSGSIWKEPKDWMMGLYQKERLLSAYWMHLPKVTIKVEAGANSPYEGHVRVTRLEVRRSSKTSGFGRKSTAANDCSRRHAP